MIVVWLCFFVVFWINWVIWLVVFGLSFEVGLLYVNVIGWDVNVWVIVSCCFCLFERFCVFVLKGMLSFCIYFWVVLVFCFGIWVCVNVNLMFVCGLSLLKSVKFWNMMFMWFGFIVWLLIEICFLIWIFVLFLILVSVCSSIVLLILLGLIINVIVFLWNECLILVSKGMLLVCKDSFLSWMFWFVSLVFLWWIIKGFFVLFGKDFCSFWFY